VDASRLSIDPIALTSPLLSGKKKRLLRERAILEYLRSLSAGEAVPNKDIARVAHFSTSSNAGQFMRQMEGRGLVELHPHHLGANRKPVYYYVVKITPRKKPELDTVIDKAVSLGEAIEASKVRGGAGVLSAPSSAIEAILPKPRFYTVDDIERKAISYSWYYGNDLKEFVKWLKSQGDKK
jgi:hypothetical protein